MRVINTTQLSIFRQSNFTFKTSQWRQIRFQVPPSKPLSNEVSNVITCCQVRRVKVHLSLQRNVTPCVLAIKEGKYKQHFPAPFPGNIAIQADVVCCAFKITCAYRAYNWVARNASDCHLLHDNSSICISSLTGKTNKNQSQLVIAWRRLFAAFTLSTLRWPKSVTAISTCSRQFQFAHGNFNLFTAISIYSR